MKNDAFSGFHPGVNLGFFASVLGLTMFIQQPVYLVISMVSGCAYLLYLQGGKGLSQETVFVICAGLLGWGGLCVHCQTVSLLQKNGLFSRTHWLGKALHALCSTALACLAAPLLPLQIPCFAAVHRIPVEEISLLTSLTVLIFLKSSSGKNTDHRI